MKARRLSVEPSESSTKLAGGESSGKSGLNPMRWHHTTHYRRQAAMKAPRGPNFTASNRSDAKSQGRA